MGYQKKHIVRNDFENKILDIEKKYFNKLLKIIQSESFIDDLLLIEKEIKDNYPEFRDIWDLKNKLKVPAERLVTHHIYMQWHSEIKGIYPSPVSSDVGIRMKDAVICVDMKTIDTDGNSGDIKSTSVEKNQTSFSNKNYPYVPMQANLKSIDHYSRLPVLTFVIKLIYTDDKYSFKLNRNKYPSIVLTCIPNGEISKLFDFNIVDNVKTYDYFSKKDGEHFEPIQIPSTLKTREAIETYMDKVCIDDRKFNRANLGGSKLAYYNTATRTLWWQTTESRKKVIRAVKSGSSVRFSNKTLKARYDSTDEPWEGYIEMHLPEPI
ncbi:hypothetical protein FZC79_22195 [Rossellomorea vietnamensis]|uniref:Restriction endonuclease n=1 Tax=Rossellomorea vietnamensis TaxID=218284 RepID=A0A5D4K7A4_9BACI|nr:hypothetical protein [Rossellomorea vietnamensis]TYR72590.1 hypothetical protein FZC79_22195 [Rossellomorea vietnamensis]